MEATMRKLTKQFSQKNYDRYVKSNIRAMTKARDKGHKDFIGITDEEISQGARWLAKVNNADEIYA